MLSRISRTFRRLAYAKTPFVATFGDAPLVDTSHIPDAEYDDVMADRAQRTRERRLAGPRAWFSFDLSDDRQVRIRRRTPPWFRTPDGLVATLPSSDEAGTVTGVWTIPSLRLLVMGSVLFVAFAVALSWGSSSGTRAFFAGFAAVASIAMLIYGETRWLSALRLLEAAVGARMMRLTIDCPSSRLHWRITRLARWLTWRGPRIDCGDGSRPVPS